MIIPVTLALVIDREDPVFKFSKGQNQYCVAGISLRSVPVEADSILFYGIASKHSKLSSIDTINCNGDITCEWNNFNYTRNYFCNRNIPNGPGYLFLEYHNCTTLSPYVKPVKKLYSYLSIKPISYKSGIADFKKLETFAVDLDESDWLDEIIQKIEDFQNLYNLK